MSARARNPGASHPTPRPASSIGDSGRTTRLPMELLSEQAQRLVVFSTVALVLWSFALMLDSFVMPWLWSGWIRNWRAISLQLCGVAGSAVMYWHLRSRQHQHREQEQRRRRDDADARCRDRGVQCLGSAAGRRRHPADLVDLPADPDLRDDRAEHAAAHAHRVDHRRVVRSDRVLGSPGCSGGRR